MRIVPGACLDGAVLQELRDSRTEDCHRSRHGGVRGQTWKGLSGHDGALSVSATDREGVQYVTCFYHLAEYARFFECSQSIVLQQQAGACGGNDFALLNYVDSDTLVRQHGGDGQAYGAGADDEYLLYSRHGVAFHLMTCLTDMSNA